MKNHPTKRLARPAAAHRERPYKREPPIVLAYRKALFSTTLSNMPEVKPRAYALMALIDSGFCTSEVLVEHLQDQMHRTTIFALLAEIVDEGLLTFRIDADVVGAPKRIFKLTSKGKKCLCAYVNYMTELVKPTPKIKKGESKNAFTDTKLATLF